MEIEGIIQRIKSDKKALSLLGVWYNSFKPIDESIQVGDEVKIVYTIKGEFKNIKSIEKIGFTKETGLFNLNSTDKNNIIIVAKDLAITFKDKNFREWVSIVRELRDGL